MIIKLEQGLVQGGEDHSLITGTKFNVFYGIPYAVPPVEELRFKPPIPAGKWFGTLDATKPRDWCLQTDLATHEKVGSEDCLFVNVFVPEGFVPPKREIENQAISTVKKRGFSGLFGDSENLQAAKQNEPTPAPESPQPLKPVMVHFCGGGFCHANESIIGSFDHLVDYDVVMVTLSHRLHIFGYLNLNIASCAGNCGSKDAVLGLKWIKDNIRAFGGDPNNVTVYGESAGAATINFLSISPMAKGLFEKAIISGGMALAPWAFNQNQVEVGFRVGRALGYEGTDAEELATFLRQKSAMALLEAVEKEHQIFRQVAIFSRREEKLTHPFTIDLLFTPSREKFPEGAFICDDPMNLMKTAPKVPTIAGVAQKEGVVIVMTLESGEKLLSLKDNMEDAIKHNQIPCQPSEVPRVAVEAKIFYLHKPKTDQEIESRLIDFYSDFTNMRFYESFQHVIKSDGPLYVYEFAYIGGLNESKIWTKGILGTYAGHTDESNYVSLSRGFFPDPQVNDADKEMIRKMCTLYTNFARTGNPNSDPIDEVEWKPYTESDPCYLRINAKSELIKGEVFEKGRAFWKYIWKNHVQSK